MAQWFYRSGTDERGPVEQHEMLFLIRSGKVHEQTPVRLGRSAEWTELRDSELGRLMPGSVSSPAASHTAVTRPQKAERRSKPVTAEPSPSVAIEAPATSSGTAVSGTHHIPKSTPRSSDTDKYTTHIVSGGIVLGLLSILIVLLLLFWYRTTPDDQLSTDAVAQTSTSEPNVTAGTATEASAEPDATAEEPVAATGETEVAPDDSNPAVGEPEAAPETSPETSPEKTEPESAVAESPLKVDEPEPRVEQRFGFILPEVDVQDDAREEPGRRRGNSSVRPSLRTSDLSARAADVREEILEEAGGTVESERAVALALEWLRKIQNDDGSWDYQDVGEDALRGQMQSPNSATAFCLLCFLGAGNTTRSGPDQDVVRRGFEYLRSHSDIAVLDQGNFYTVALVAMCHSELAAMEPEDDEANELARVACRFVQDSQDPQGGGWRYWQKSAGDLSVTGWQVMALQSAKSSGNKIDELVVRQTSKFLDSVSVKGGSQYAYTPGSPSTQCMTAVGLLSRMYLGWNDTMKPLRAGILDLSKVGPDQNDAYYNYYATLVMHHAGGSHWKMWNEVMREQLINTQVVDGPAAGSWRVTDPHGASGGQIYQTCLSVLTLEVYYRYLPLFDKEKK